LRVIVSDLDQGFECHPVWETRGDVSGRATPPPSARSGLAAMPSASGPSAALGDTLTDLGGNHSRGNQNHGRGSGSLLSRKSIFTNVDGQPLSGSVFIYGPLGTVGLT
jgi:hypothetical protein